MKTKNGFWILLCGLIFNFFIDIDCHHSTAPEDIQPGRRDYTWYIDTIYAGGNMTEGIDGSSQSDVWFVSEAGDFSQTFYHFDGTKWSTDNINRAIAPNAVRAFASNDVWSVGLGGDIWHYNGSSWNRQTKIAPPGTNYYSLNDVDGNSTTDLTAVGDLSYTGTDLHGIIYHFNGSSWMRINIPDVLCTFPKVRFYGHNKALILGSMHISDGSAPDSSKIFTFDGNNLQQIYSAQENYLNQGNFARVSGGIIISRGMHITFFNGMSEQDILTIQNNLYRNGIEARSIKDIFLGMLDGLAHYDGTDVQYLFYFDNPNLRGSLIKAFDNSIFIASYDNSQQKIIIRRGYLRQ